MKRILLLVLFIFLLTPISAYELTESTISIDNADIFNCFYDNIFLGLIFGVYTGGEIIVILIKKFFKENISNYDGLVYSTLGWVIPITLIYVLNVNIFIINYILKTNSIIFVFLNFVIYGIISVILGHQLSKR